MLGDFQILPALNTQCDLGRGASSRASTAPTMGRRDGPGGTVTCWPPGGSPWFKQHLSSTCCAPGMVFAVSKSCCTPWARCRGAERCSGFPKVTGCWWSGDQTTVLCADRDLYTPRESSRKDMVCVPIFLHWGLFPHRPPPHPGPVPGAGDKRQVTHKT